MKEEQNLMRLCVVTRKQFGQNVTDMNGQSLANQTYFEVTLKELSRYGERKVLGGQTYKKTIFKNDRMCSDIYQLFTELLKDDQNNWTLKKDESKSIADLELFVEAYGATVKLETPYRNRDNDGKWRTPITAVSVVAMGRKATYSDDGKIEISPATGEDPIAIKNRILKNFNYIPVENVINESGESTSTKDKDLDNTDVD